MNADQFYQSRQVEWGQLSRLLEKCKSGVRQLSPAEVRQLGNLYRGATSDLALAQREFPQHKITRYLNQLVAHSHSVLYHSEPLTRRRLLRFVLVDFPQLYRQCWPFILTATLLFLLPAIASGLAVYLWPESATWLLGSGVESLIERLKEQELWTNIPVAERPYASSFIMTNNIQVSFLAFAGGVTAGLLTIYVLINNGIMIGGLTALTAHYGLGFSLWSFVIGHGVIELSTIFIAGGSGLLVGWALIHPGLQRRSDALLLAARKAVVLVMGCIPLLIMAGLIEGFLSPNATMPWPVKWGVGALSGLLLYGYLLLAGRRAGAEKL